MATADEILTLQEIKRQLFIPDEETSQDVLLTGYRDAAIEYVASQSGRHLLDGELLLEVPVRYVPLSTAPFRVADLKEIDRIDFHDEDTRYWNDSGWQLSGDWYYDGGCIVPYASYLSVFPASGLRVYRTEAETPPGLSSEAVRFERVGSKNLWRAWPLQGTTWDRIHPYLPVRLDCKVGMDKVPKVFTVCCLIYVRFLWSQMPDFREAHTIDRMLRGHVALNIDEQAQRVIEVESNEVV